jgi:hypothetical protein
MLNSELLNNEPSYFEPPKPTLMQRLSKLFSCCSPTKCDCGYGFCDGTLCYRTSFIKERPPLNDKPKTNNYTEI